MNMHLYRVDLPLAHEFTIARGSIRTQPSLIVELEHEGVSGFGEVTENDFYGHTFSSMTASLNKLAPRLSEFLDRSPLEYWDELSEMLAGDMFALSAFDMAAHDLYAQRVGQPTWQTWGLQWENVPDSSFTIGIDQIDVMVAKLAEQPGWSIYKIKLGTPHDLEIVRELRRHTAATFRVDANCGWTPAETISNAHVLAELGVEFIEQPLPHTASSADKQLVYQESVLPIIADEDCQVAADVQRCHGLFHGVNVKICKCGGLTPALHMLREARALGMRTMVGCMVESHIGISGSAHLLPLLDYADLDGTVLLRDTPTTGVEIDRGQVRLTNRSGNGGQLIRERLQEFEISSGKS